MGTYGTPPATRTDSGSGQLIVPPRHVLYTKTCVEQASKLVGQIHKETLYAVYLLVVTLASPFYAVVGNPDLDV